MHWYSSNKSNLANFTTINSSGVSTTYPNSLTTAQYQDSLWIVEDRSEALGPIEYQFTGSYDTLKNAVKLDKNITENPISDANYRDIKGANGKIIKDSDNKYWRLSFVEQETSVSEFAPSDDANIVTAMEGYVNAAGLEIWGSFERYGAYYSYKLRKVKVTLTEVPNSITLNYEVNFGNYYNTDSPYNIVVIPANGQLFRPGQNPFVADEIINKKILEQIMLKAGKWLLDVQIIPYFPVYEWVDTNIINISRTNAYVSTESEATAFGAKGWWCYYVQTPSFEFNIPLNLYINNKSNPTAIDYKIENECNMYRICSPNYNGSFEFNLAKNNGMSNINVDVTLRPYNPYFHLNPSFDGLYGKDYNDCRGLICQGDFSLPIINDQFKNYEIENKNYQQMFNRQIENMEFAQGQERTQAGWQIFGGAIQGATTGAIAGNMIGNGVGAGVGALVGGITSVAGGIMDYNMLTERQKEQKDYAIDTWRYQLGNIKALPTTVNKITPLTNNNKIFPVLEFYTCTDEEKNLFNNYLTYKSMNINAIGSISDYKQDNRTFIKGTFIRLENSDLAGNELYEIYSEMNKGVYI